MGRKRTGSIIQRASGWEVWVGKEYVGTLPNAAAAEKARDAWLRRDAGAPADRFSVFANRWLDERETSGHVRGVQRERSKWNAHVVTASWYDWQFKRITPAVLQQWIGELFKTNKMHAIRTRDGIERRPTRKRLARKYIANILGIVKRCFDHAVVAGLVKENPAKAVILPPVEVRERGDQLIVHLTAEEVERLFQQPLAATERAWFAVAVYGGLRLGELIALRWQDVTLGKRPVVRVRRSHKGPVKTPKSIRDVPLLPPAAEALEALKREQAKRGMIGGLVFPAADGGLHHASYTANWRDKPERRGGKLCTFKGWRSRAGIRAQVNFHALRHTCGCHLLQGTWAKRGWLKRALRMQEVSLWLGHSSVGVTEAHYATLAPDSLSSVVDASEVLAEAVRT